MSARATCSHCGSNREVYGSYQEGGGPLYQLCHPNEGMDCYRLVTVYHEPIGARLPGGELFGKRAPIPDNPLPFAGWWVGK